MSELETARAVVNASPLENWNAEQQGWIGCPNCMPELRTISLPRALAGDFPIGHTTRAAAGLHEATFNPHGAVTVRAGNGQMLGVKPGEFRWCNPVPPFDRWCKGEGGIHR